MAFGSLALVAASFEPWFVYGLGATAHGGSNAWGSDPWAGTVLAGIGATLVWFGAPRRLPAQWRPPVAAGLLVVGLGLAVHEWWAVPNRTYGIAIVTVGTPPETLAAPEPFWLEFEPAHHTAVLALAGMLAVAAPAAMAARFRRGGGTRPVAR